MAKYEVTVNVNNLDAYHVHDGDIVADYYRRRVGLQVRSDGAVQELPTKHLIAFSSKRNMAHL